MTDNSQAHADRFEVPNELLQPRVTGAPGALGFLSYTWCVDEANVPALVRAEVERALTVLYGTFAPQHPTASHYLDSRYGPAPTNR